MITAMENYFYKPDDRKPWQKNILIAIIVLTILYIIEVIQDIGDLMVRFINTFIIKSSATKLNTSGKPNAYAKHQTKNALTDQFSTTN